MGQWALFTRCGPLLLSTQGGAIGSIARCIHKAHASQHTTWHPLHPDRLTVLRAQVWWKSTSLMYLLPHPGWIAARAKKMIVCFCFLLFGRVWVFMGHFWVRRGPEMIPSHVALPSFNMSPYRVIQTHFRQTFLDCFGKHVWEARWHPTSIEEHDLRLSP